MRLGPKQYDYYRAIQTLREIKDRNGGMGVYKPDQGLWRRMTTLRMDVKYDVDEKTRQWIRKKFDI